MNQPTNVDKDEERERNRINQRNCRQRKAAASGNIMIVTHKAVKHAIPTPLLRLPIESIVTVAGDAYKQLLIVDSSIVLKRNLATVEEMRVRIKRARSSSSERKEDKENSGERRTFHRPFLESYVVDLHGELKELERAGICTTPVPEYDDFYQLILDVYEERGPFDATETTSEILDDLRGPVYEHYKLKPSTKILRPRKAYDEEDDLVYDVESDLAIHLRALKRQGKARGVKWTDNPEVFRTQMVIPCLRALKKTSHFMYLPQATELFDRLYDDVLARANGD